MDAFEILLHRERTSLVSASQIDLEAVRCRIGCDYLEFGYIGMSWALALQVLVEGSYSSLEVV